MTKPNKYEERKALEKLIQDTFCDKENVNDCAYKGRVWCLKTCGYWTKLKEQAKYWNR